MRSCPLNKSATFQNNHLDLFSSVIFTSKNYKMNSLAPPIDLFSDIL